MGRRRFRLRAGSRCAISECLGSGDREDGYSRSSSGGERDGQRDLCKVDSPAIWTGRSFAEEGELCFAGGGAAAGRDPRGDSSAHRQNRGRSSNRFLGRSEEHTSELQSHVNLVCRLLLEKKKNIRY